MTAVDRQSFAVALTYHYPDAVLYDVHTQGSPSSKNRADFLALDKVAIKQAFVISTRNTYTDLTHDRYRRTTVGHDWRIHVGDVTKLKILGRLSAERKLPEYELRFANYLTTPRKPRAR